MANSYRTGMHDELDEIHRLLPREILEDIDIVDPAEQQALDVVEDLAAHLASVLGGAPKKTSYHHHPQANVGHRLGCGMDALAGKVSAPGVAVPPFLPSPPAVPWHVMEGLSRNNNMALHPTANMGFAAPARPLLAGGGRPTTTAVCRGVGTGVFLPRRSRTEVVRRTAKAPRPPPPSNSDYARMVHQRVQQQAAMVIVRSQQEMRAVAERRRYFLGVHPHPELELRLPQEWAY